MPISTRNSAERLMTTQRPQGSEEQLNEKRLQAYYDQWATLELTTYQPQTEVSIQAMCRQ